MSRENGGGRPRIRGYRLWVKDVLELLARGAPREEILEDYPFLKREDIQACLDLVSARLLFPRTARVHPDRNRSCVKTLQLWQMVMIHLSSVPCRIGHIERKELPASLSNRFHGFNRIALERVKRKGFQTTTVAGALFQSVFSGPKSGNQGLSFLRNDPSRYK